MRLALSRCAASVSVLLVVATGCGSGDTATDTVPTTAAPPPAAAYSFANLGCIPAEAVQDSGKTLVYDFATPPGASESDEFKYDFIIQCIKMVTLLPDSVWAQMHQTSALQGRQEADWDVDVAQIPEAQIKVKPMANAKLSASWTYHPDNGLDVIMTVRG